VEAKVVSAENVRVALAYVARGEAPLGIVYDTDARAEPRVRIVGLLPESSHPRIVYPGAVTARSRHPQGRRFVSFLASPAARGIFVQQGFRPL
jgi:molybdate transport system substrate-binding protein